MDVAGVRDVEWCMIAFCLLPRLLVARLLACLLRLCCWPRVASRVIDVDESFGCC